MRLVKTYLDLSLPTSNIHFLMSERNRGDTFSGFEKLTENLVQEIFTHLLNFNLKPARISFIGHSLGSWPPRVGIVKGIGAVSVSVSVRGCCEVEIRIGLGAGERGHPSFD